MFERLMITGVLIVFVCAGGCATNSSSSKSMTTAQSSLLSKLRGCLDVVKASSSRDFVSPCAKDGVASLSGIALVDMVSALRPQGISSDDYTCVSRPDSPCGNATYEARWGFYRLEGLGGGPELQCVSEDRKICMKVRWVITQ